MPRCLSHGACHRTSFQSNVFSTLKVIGEKTGYFQFIQITNHNNFDPPCPPCKDVIARFSKFTSS